MAKSYMKFKITVWVTFRSAQLGLIKTNKNYETIIRIMKRLSSLFSSLLYPLRLLIEGKIIRFECLMQRRFNEILANNGLIFLTISSIIIIYYCYFSNLFINRKHDLFQEIQLTHLLD
jgi:hypothetical protein